MDDKNKYILKVGKVSMVKRDDIGQYWVYLNLFILFVYSICLYDMVSNNIIINKMGNKN